MDQFSKMFGSGQSYSQSQTAAFEKLSTVMSSYPVGSARSDYYEEKNLAES